MIAGRRALADLTRLALAGLASALLLCAGCSDSGEDGSGGEASTASLDSVRERLGDRMFEFGRSSGNSDRNAHVTGINQLQLCKCGLFGWKETTSFSSSVGSMVSEHIHRGTWKLTSSNGRIVVDLNPRETDAKEVPGPTQFIVTLDGDTVRFDGASSTEENVQPNCEQAAAAQPR